MLMSRWLGCSQPQRQFVQSNVKIQRLLELLSMTYPPFVRYMVNGDGVLDESVNVDCDYGDDGDFIIILMLSFSLLASTVTMTPVCGPRKSSKPLFLTTGGR